MNPVEPIFDHVLSVHWRAITDSVKSTLFFQEHRAAIMREAARVRSGKPLPPAQRPPKPSTFDGVPLAEVEKRVAQDFRTIPIGGIFGASHRKP